MNALRCRSCDERPLLPVLDLGLMPLANALPAPNGSGMEAKYPLGLARCPSCSLVQITETVSPEVLFREYVYYSSFSETALEHAAKLASDLSKRLTLGPTSFVVEIASNDGYLLQNFLPAKIRVLGIEPAKNLAEVSRAKGIPTECEFFGLAYARELTAKVGGADVIIANNVLAHVPDLNGFVEGTRVLLKPTGVAVFEVPYVREMVERLEFDTIYHEHLCYFSVTALHDLLRRHGLELQDIERIPIHGGSLRLFAVHAGASRPTSRVQALLLEEEEWGIRTGAPYRRFADQVMLLRESLVRLLGSLKGQGRAIAAYGAAAKGAVLLNYCRIGPETVDFVVDKNPRKQGRLMPGVRIPIGDPDMLRERRPDYLLVLAWNIADEVLRQNGEYRESGGKFIIPVPLPKVV